MNFVDFSRFYFDSSGIFWIYFLIKKSQKGLFILGTREADVARCAHVVDHARPCGRRRGHVDSVGLTFYGLTSTVGSG